MSSNKKSSGSLLLLLLAFIVIAGVSWFFFSNKANHVEQDKQDLAAKITKDIESSSDKKTEMGDHSGHNHAATADSGPDIGIKGKIHELNPPAVYGHRGIGNPDAPVKIQEFFSLTCNHCADFHKNTYQKIKKNLIDTGKVYFVHEEFPLNGPALYGSMIARCLPTERYVGFIDLLLRQQDKWAFGGDFKSALIQNAKLAGMSEEEFETCFNNKDLQKAIATNIKEASDVWKINSTPSFVINNGERVLLGSKNYETFEKLVEQLTNGETDAQEIEGTIEGSDKNFE